MATGLAARAAVLSVSFDVVQGRAGAGTRYVRQAE
jgi:hypothetical protein